MTVVKKPNRTGIMAVTLKGVLKFALPLLKFSKLILAGVSLAAWSWLFTWQFGVIIMAVIFIHESTHVLFMKLFHMRVKGMYFLPFVGAVAVSDESWPDRTAEAWIAYAGPFTGLVLGLAGLGIYHITHSGEVAAVTAFIALINLFNLLPVNPLDGGRVLKSVAVSISSRFGFVLMMILLSAGAVLAVLQNIWLFAIIIPVGAVDLLIDYRSEKTKTAIAPLSRAQRPVVFTAYAGLALALYGIMLATAHVPGSVAAMHALQG